MPVALITSPVNNVSTDVGHTELYRVGALILPIFRHKNTERSEHLLRDTQLVGGGQDPPAPHCSSSPRVRDSTALCRLLLALSQASSTSLSASGTFLSGAHGSYSHPHGGGAAGPALCVSAQLPKAASGFLGSLPPGICSSRRSVSLGQRLEPLLGAGQHRVGWSKTFLGLSVTGGASVMAAVGLAGLLSSGFQHEGTTLCLKLRCPSEGQGRAGPLQAKTMVTVVVLQGFAQAAAHKNVPQLSPSCVVWVPGGVEPRFSLCPLWA